MRIIFKLFCWLLILAGVLFITSRMVKLNDIYYMLWLLGTVFIGFFGRIIINGITDIIFD